MSWVSTGNRGNGCEVWESFGRSNRAGVRVRGRPRRKPRTIRVRHPKFGDGTVKSIGSDRYVVQFDQVGEKTIISSFLEILG